MVTAQQPRRNQPVDNRAPKGKRAIPRKRDVGRATHHDKQRPCEASRDRCNCRKQQDFGIRIQRFRQDSEPENVDGKEYHREPNRDPVGAACHDMKKKHTENGPSHDRTYSPGNSTTDSTSTRTSNTTHYPVAGRAKNRNKPKRKPGPLYCWECVLLYNRQKQTILFLAGCLIDFEIETSPLPLVAIQWRFHSDSPGR